MKPPSTCCKNVGDAGPFEACGGPATYWYAHNGNVDEGLCSYCDRHNYVCGTRLVPIPCAGCQEPQIVSFDLVEEFTGCLHCDKCFPTKVPCETCGKDSCDGECCNCEFCVRRRLPMEYDKAIVAAAEAAVDDWERGLKARENGNVLAVNNIQLVQQAVNAKREALGLTELVRLIGRAIEAAASSDAITDEETEKLRAFAATLQKQ